MSEFVPVATLDQLPAGKRMTVQLEGREIALFNVEGRIHAIDNICLHRGGPLAEGVLDGTVIACPYHNWTFDLVDGVCTFNPNARMDTFPVRVIEGRVCVAPAGGEAPKTSSALA